MNFEAALARMLAVSKVSDGDEAVSLLQAAVVAHIDPVFRDLCADTKYIFTDVFAWDAEEAHAKVEELIMAPYPPDNAVLAQMPKYERTLCAHDGTRAQRAFCAALFPVLCESEGEILLRHAVENRLNHELQRKRDGLSSRDLEHFPTEGPQLIWDHTYECYIIFLLRNGTVEELDLLDKIYEFTSTHSTDANLICEYGLDATMQEEDGHIYYIKYEVEDYCKTFHETLTLIEWDMLSSIMLSL